jgi:hypothetical protein
MGTQQDASLGGLNLSPQTMSVSPLHAMATLQSPTDDSMSIEPNVLAHRRAPSSVHGSYGIFGYSTDVNNDKMHVGTPYIAPNQTFPDPGTSSDPPLVAVPGVMMHRYGHRQTTGSIGD